MADGQVLCWGRNEFGQLGTVPSNPKSSPQVVPGAPQATLVEAGRQHNCLLSGGQPFCWGDNSHAQLGYGYTSSRVQETPVAMDVTGIVDVGAGAWGTCSRDATGAVQCWGRAYDGELGIGALHQTGPSQVPVSPENLDYSAVLDAGGNGACAIDGNGGLRCWGRNSLGQVGVGHRDPAVAPLTPILTDVVDVGAGDFFSNCAVRANGEAHCWGHGLSDAPEMVPGIDGLSARAVRIATGDGHRCAVMDTGKVMCWGQSQYGQLGDGVGFDPGYNVTRNTPALVEGLDDAIDIEVGRYHSCALRKGGKVSCWGSNHHGQLGIGIDDIARTPTPVTELLGNP